MGCHRIPWDAMLHMYTYISISKLLGPPNEASHKLFKLRSLADLYPTSRRHDTEAMEPVNFMGMVDCRGPIKNSKSEKTHSKIQQLCSFRNEMKANKHAKTSSSWRWSVDRGNQSIHRRSHCSENPNSQQAANLIVVEHSSWVACQIGNNPVLVASNTVLAMWPYAMRILCVTGRPFSSVSC